MKNTSFINNNSTIFKEDKDMTNTSTFYGVEASRYGIEKNCVDMKTLGLVLKGVSADEIFKMTAEYGIGTWEVVNGSLYIHYDCAGNYYTDKEAQERIQELEELIEDADEGQEDKIAAWRADIESLEDCEVRDIHQYYLISEKAANILMEESEEQIVFYNDVLNAYIWGITFCGASWSEVLTDIPLNRSGQDA